VPNPAKTVAKSEPVKYAKSVEDLMEEQFTQKKEVDDFDWDSMFADYNFESSSATSTKKITTKNTVKGTAGTTTDSSNNSVVSSNTKSTLTSKVSDSTSGKLGKISNSEFVGKASISEVTNVESTIGSNGKVSVKMANGQSRVLINPAEPKIYISEAASKLIEGSVTVTIKFTVLESGNVPSQEITITPASLLPSVVRNEIVSQLSQWRVEADEFAAIATLEFSIIKK
jgi:outer membrane biosynthesis protein TonB